MSPVSTSILQRSVWPQSHVWRAEPGSVRRTCAGVVVVWMRARRQGRTQKQGGGWTERQEEEERKGCNVLQGQGDSSAGRICARGKGTASRISLFTHPLATQEGRVKENEPTLDFVLPLIFQSLLILTLGVVMSDHLKIFLLYTGTRARVTYATRPRVCQHSDITANSTCLIVRSVKRGREVETRLA